MFCKKSHIINTIYAMNKKKLFFFFLLSAILISCSPSNDFNVRRFGAKGVKSHLATKNIQKAIDACHKAGGGWVYFPPGEYLSGTLLLKDNVTLYIEAGATLYASHDTNDYKTTFKVYKKNDSGKKGKGETPVFIYAIGAKNIGIMGKGTINGQALRTYEDLKEIDGFIRQETENARKAGVEMKMYYKVPPYTCMIFLEKCYNVKIRDVSLIESTDWTLHFKWSENIFVDNIYLSSSLEKGVNADGIDVDGCKNVVITNSIIETGDDAIVLKTTQTDTIALPCENITVSNCVLVSTSTALKLGTESFADFRHITFSNCVVRNSNRGLSIVVRDGAVVENVLFSDITIECNRKHFNWWGNGDPIWVVLLKRSEDSKIGRIRNIAFRNIIAHGQGTSKIEGFPGVPLENIFLSNIRFFMNKEEYPDKRAVHAFEAHDVNNLSMSDMEFFWNEKDTEPAWQSACYIYNIKGVRLDKLSLAPAPGTRVPAIRIKNVSDAIIEHCKAKEGTTILVSVEGEKSNTVIFNDNYLSAGQSLFIAGREVLANSIKHIGR